MAETIKNKFFSGVFWSFVQNVVLRVFGFIFTILLTRLLSPEDFGLMGMMAIFIAVSEIFILSGFGQALVQKKNCTDDDFSTAFYFNVVVAVTIYIVLFFSAPLIANFYHEPQLVLLTRVLALNFVIGSLNIVQRSRLTKTMNFKPLAMITLIGSITGGIIGVTLAFCGFGVWALVGQTLSSSSIQAIVFPFFTKWKPNRPFSYASLKQLWDYGSKILVTGILGVIMRNISSILIGRFYDKEQVGYFHRAQSLAEIYANILHHVLDSVSFSAFCNLQDENERRMLLYKKILFGTVLIVSPVMVLMALLAKPLVLILFTEKWLPCVPMLQAFLLARMLMPIGATQTALLRSAGYTTAYMRMYFITMPISLFAIVVAIPFGVNAMAWATLVSAIINFMITTYVVGRKFSYGVFSQIWEWRMIALSLLIMSIGVFLILHFISNIWQQLLIGGCVGSGLFLLCCKMFNLVDDILKDMILSKLRYKRRK